MAKDSFVEINIFGRVSDAEAVWNLAMPAASASASAPWSNGFDIADFGNQLVDAERAGRALTIEIHDNWDVFEDLRGACQKAELSYVAFISEAGEARSSCGVSWHPGMDEEFEFLMSGDRPKLTLAVEDIAEAEKAGLDAVSDLLETTIAATRIGRIEIDPGFIESYEQHCGYGVMAAAF